jgi:hypothetical protein
MKRLINKKTRRHETINGTIRNLRINMGMAPVGSGDGLLRSLEKMSP